MTPKPPAAAPPTVDLEEGRRLIEKMTPAPWEYAGGTITNWHDHTFDMEWMPNRRGPNEGADGAGMVWLRNNAEALISRLSASEARVRELEAEIAELRPLAEEARVRQRWDGLSFSEKVGEILRASSPPSALSVGGATGDGKGAEG